MTKPGTSLHPLVACIITVVVVVLVTFLRLAIAPWMGSYVPFILFYAAVAVGAYVGGWRCGALAAFLSAGVASYYFLLPTHSFALNGTPELIALISFLIVCSVIIGVTEMVRRTAVTANRAAEEARSREAEFRAHFDLTLVGNAQTDTEQGRFLRVNPRFCAITGYSEQELLTKTFDELTHPEDRGESMRMLQELKAGARSSFAIEKRYLRRDGAIAWVHVDVTLLRDSRGVASRTLAVVEDITARKIAEEKSRFLVAIVESSDDAVMSTDCSGVVTTWNKGAEQLFGYPASEAVGRPISLIVPPAHNDQEAETVEQITHGQLAAHYEAVRQHKDGTRIDVSISMAPIRDHAGKVAGASIIARNIAERRAAERRVRVENVVIRAITNAHNSPEAIHNTLVALCSEGRWRCGAFWRVQRSGDGIRCTDFWSDRGSTEIRALEQETQACSFARGQGIPGRVWATGAPLWIAQVQQDSALPRSPFIVAAELRSGCAVPVMIGDSVVGVIELFSTALRPRDDAFLHTMYGLAGHLGHFIERKRFEDELQKSESQLQALLDYSPAIVFLKDVKGRFLLINRRFEILIGKTRSEVLGKTAGELFAPHVAEPLIAQDKLVLEKGVAQNFEEVIATEQIECTFMSVKFPVASPSGEPWAIGGIGVDVTEARAAEITAREAEARLRAALEAGKMGAWEWEVATNRVTWSDRLFEFHGLRREEFDGTVEGFFRLVHPADVPRVEESLRQALVERRPYDLEFRAVRPDGSIRWLGTSARVVFDDSGRPIRMVGGTIDLTERKQIETELRATQQRLEQQAAELESTVQERTQELQQSLQAVEHLCYTIAHDLRAPLRGMQGFAKALHDDFSEFLDDVGRGYTQRIIRAATRMDGLITDLLAYGRLGTADVTTLPLELDTLIDAFLADYAEETKARRATICVERMMPVVMANRTMLSQVIANLLMNAMKFVAPEVNPSIRVYAEKKEERVRLFVEDNGIGIAPEHAGKLFQIFQRLHGPESYPGTGIGLAIVKKAVERMNGTSGFTSTPGQGSTFWIELPGADAIGAHRRSLPREPKARGE